jgi:hypothetical protein
MLVVADRLWVCVNPRDSSYPSLVSASGVQELRLCAKIAAFRMSVITHKPKQQHAQNKTRCTLRCERQPFALEFEASNRGATLVVSAGDGRADCVARADGLIEGQKKKAAKCEHEPRRNRVLDNEVTVALGKRLS